MSSVSTHPRMGTGCSPDRMVQIFRCLCPRNVCVLYRSVGGSARVVYPRCAAWSHASQPGCRAETGRVDGRFAPTPSMSHFYLHSKKACVSVWVEYQATGLDESSIFHSVGWVSWVSYVGWCDAEKTVAYPVVGEGGRQS